MAGGIGTRSFRAPSSQATIWPKQATILTFTKVHRVDRFPPPRLHDNVVMVITLPLGIFRTSHPRAAGARADATFAVLRVLWH
jgi:hypothetical protein